MNFICYTSLSTSSVFLDKKIDFFPVTWLKPIIFAPPLSTYQKNTTDKVVNLVTVSTD